MPDNKHLPAYPCTITEGKDFPNDRRRVDCKGLTKREMIAAMCLQGLLSNPELILKPDQSIEELSIQSADTLLSHLENTSK